MIVQQNLKLSRIKNMILLILRAKKKRVFSLESKSLDLKGTFQITKKGFL